MTAPSKSFTTIADSAIDQDSPLTSTLMTYLRDNDIHLEEWIGRDYVAAINHDHDTVNSAGVAGASGGKYISIKHYFGTGAIGTHAAMENKPDVGIFCKVDVTGTVVHLKHVGDDTTESTAFTVAGKVAVGLTDLTYGGCHQTAAGSFNASAVKHVQALFKSYSGLIAYGVYAGTGAQQDISIGFQPKLVIVFRATTGAVAAVLRFDAHASTDSQTTGSGMSTTSITSLLSTGFRVLSSTQANAAATDYAYIAFAEGQVSGEAIDYVTWSGDAASGRTIATGFTPQLILALRTDTSSNAYLASNHMMPGQAFTLGGTLTGSIILNVVENGFTVGSGADINAAGGTYAALVFKGGLRNAA